MTKKTLKEKCACALDKVNLAKTICNHLLGKQHTIVHRMLVGVAIMCVGVAFVELTASIHVVHYVTNIAGYGIHAVGATPFIEWAAGLTVDEPTEVIEELEQGI